jgi:tetratricopeptide (TPR) repeat protein
MLLIVAVVALAARFIYLTEIRSSPFFEVPVIDAEVYDAMARRIAAGHLAGGSTAFWQAPLYPYLLAALYRLGCGAFEVRLVQALLGVATAVLITSLAAKLLGRRAGFLAGLAAALYGPFLVFEGRLLAPALILVLNVAGLVALEHARHHPGLRWRAFAGFLFGLATLARPDAFFVTLVLGAGLLASEWRSGPAKVGLGRRAGAMTRAAVFVGVAFLTTLPATARNWIVARDLVWVSANGGINFYLGNNARAEETVEIRPGRAWENLVETPHREAGLTRASDRSRYFYGEGLRFARSEPAAWAALLARKTAQFFAGIEIRRNEDPYQLRRESSLIRFLLWRAGPLAFPFGIVSPLALLGAIVLWPRRRELLLVYLYAAAYALAVVIFFVTARYRLPALPALLILAAGAVDWFLVHLRAPRVALRFAGGFAVLALLLNANPAVPDLDTDAEHWRLLAIAEYERGNALAAVEAQEKAIAGNPNAAELHYDQGLYRTAASDTVGAVAAYRRAIALDPAYGEPKVNLGNLLVAHGDYPGAVRLFLQAAVADPNLVPAQIAVGNAFLHSGHADSALARYDRALALDPASAEAAVGKMAALEAGGRFDEAIAAGREAMKRAGERANLLAALGRALKSAGRNAEAVTALRAALGKEPRRAETWVTLGQCYRRLNRLDEAEAAQKQAIALKPELVQAHVNLADVYARRGLYDQAIASLERALALEPFNTAAIYNLAVVHAQLGQEAEAIRMLENLLAVTPDHQAGRQALARLRGDPEPHLHWRE